MESPYYVPSSPTRPPGPPHGTGDLRTPVDLLNINEVAATLRVSKMTVYRLIRDGRLPAIRVVNSLRVPRGDLDTFLNAAFLPPSNGSEPARGDSQSGPSGI
jgi:excisionase family DNA binding protein